jgi:zinc metalloprotease ZmpB
MTVFSQKWLMWMIVSISLTPLLAQKAPSIHPKTIVLSDQPDEWRIEGNRRINAATGYPIAIYQEQFQGQPGSPEAIAKAYLSARKDELGLTDDDISTHLKVHVVRERTTGHVVRLRQVYANLPVNHNAEITIHINRSGIVDFVMNGFVHGVDLPTVQPIVVASTAMETVENYLEVSGAISFLSNELMVLQHAGKNYLVHRLVIATDAPLGEWEALVNAETGELMQVKDISCYHKDETQDAAISVPPALYFFSPPVNGTGTVFQPDPLTSATVAYNATGYTDGSDANTSQLTAQHFSVTLQDITQNGSTYSLVGPYAEIRDFEAPNLGLFSQSSSTFNFLRADNAFEAVNTYYHIDQMMRHLNVTLALDIIPYQYAGGVRFDPSGLSGADNSHYLTGSGQLALGEGGVDDAEDADVIIHELGHGLHDWVTDGGLSQQNGLSEGVGDYIAGSYSRHLGFWPTNQAAYHWVFNWDGHNPFWNGRILNYTAIYPSGLVGSIHTDGQIWATANMKIWDDIGRDDADRVFFSGLATTNSSTNQNDAANAVYQAAINLGYSYADRLAIHTRYTAAGYTLPAAPLPVEWVRFEARKANTTTELSWQTASERGADYFAIERSSSDTHWQPIGRVAAKGDSQVLNNYQFTDQQPLKGTNYYRLQQVDRDGEVSYSNIVQVEFDAALSLEMYPNPASQLLYVVLTAESGVIQIYDWAGQLVQEQPFQTMADKQPNTLDISALPVGGYTVQVVAEGTVLAGKIFKSE